MALKGRVIGDLPVKARKLATQPHLVRADLHALAEHAIGSMILAFDGIPDIHR